MNNKTINQQENRKSKLALSQKVKNKSNYEEIYEELWTFLCVVFSASI